MRNAISKTASAVVLLVVVFVVLSGRYRAAVPVVHAQSQIAGCSVATLQGSYANAFSFMNTTGVVPAPLGPTYTPGAGLGTVSFDGQGHAFSKGTLSIGGLIVVTTPTTASYTVNSDCTGLLRIGSAVRLHLVIADSGNEIHTLSLATGDVSVGTMKKQ